MFSNVMPIGGTIHSHLRIAAYIIRQMPRPLPTGATFLDRIMTVQEARLFPLRPLQIGHPPLFAVGEGGR
jgi:hypothetical protein